MAGVGGGPVAVHGRDPHDGRVAHGRRGQVAQRVVVGALALHSTEAEALGREAGGQGHANATATFALNDGGGTLHTHAQISGKAASMGEGVVSGVLDALITDFTTRLGDI